AAGPAGNGSDGRGQPVPARHGRAPDSAKVVLVQVFGEVFQAIVHVLPEAAAGPGRVLAGRGVQRAGELELGTHRGPERRGAVGAVQIILQAPLLEPPAELLVAVLAAQPPQARGRQAHGGRAPAMAGDDSVHLRGLVDLVFQVAGGQVFQVGGQPAQVGHGQVRRAGRAGGGFLVGPGAPPRPAGGRLDQRVDVVVQGGEGAGLTVDLVLAGDGGAVAFQPEGPLLRRRRVRPGVLAQVAVHGLQHLPARLLLQLFRIIYGDLRNRTGTTDMDVHSLLLPWIKARRLGVRPGLCQPPRARRGNRSIQRERRRRRFARVRGIPSPLQSLLMSALSARQPAPPPGPVSPLRAAITDAWLRDETTHVRELLDQARLDPARQAEVDALAADLVRRVRARAADQGAIEAFMRQYDLGSEEGVLLMCVAEALLRIPDQDTADKLIRDKLGDADWEKHLGQSESVLVNASTWGLMLTGRLVNLNDMTRHDVPGAFKRLVGRVGEPVVRLAVRQAMRIMGHQFVMGR